MHNSRAFSLQGSHNPLWLCCVFLPCALEFSWSSIDHASWTVFRPSLSDIWWLKLVNDTSNILQIHTDRHVQQESLFTTSMCLFTILPGVLHSLTVAINFETWIVGNVDGCTIFQRNLCSFSSSFKFSVNGVRICLLYVSEFIILKKKLVPIIVSVIAHHTPSFISCSGTWCVSLGVSANQYTLFWVLTCLFKYRQPVPLT